MHLLNVAFFTESAPLPVESHLKERSRGKMYNNYVLLTLESPDLGCLENKSQSMNGMVFSLKLERGFYHMEKIKW